jgi:Skp family chaperone for outer membrane proteins
MSKSSSLADGIIYNKKQRSLVEGMNSMKNTTILNNITLESNDISWKQISETYKDNEQKYKELASRFNAIKSQLETNINTYITSSLQTDKTITVSGNSLSHTNDNIFVTEPGNVMPSDAKYQGCYTDNQSPRAIPNEQPEGYVFDVNSCAQRAIDQGATVFGLQNVNDAGMSVCFTGNKLEDATKYGVAYSTKHYWYARNKEGYVMNSNILKLFSNGVMMMFSTPDVSSDDSNVLYSTYRDGGGKMADGCNKDVGGVIQNVVASYGMNCLDGNYTPDSTSTKPFVGNYTPYFKQIMGMDKGIYNVAENNGDPAQGCPKDFDLTYTCGDGATKTINIPAPSTGKPVSLDCSAEAQRCGGIRMVMQNDGNLVILDGSDTLLWQSGTGNPSNVGDTSVDEWLKNSVNGRDYLKAGETMKRGDILTSSSGKNILAFDNGGYLILICSSGTKCKVVNNNTFGTALNNAVYSLPQSNIDNIGSFAYVDETGKKYAHPNYVKDMPDLDDNIFITIGTYTSYDPDISSFSATNIDDCQDAASKNPDCGGFVFNNKQQRCYLKSKHMWPRSSRVLDKESIMKIKAPKLNVNNSCTKNINTITSAQFELYPNSNNQMTPDLKCGLAKYVDENKPPYDKENDELMRELNEVLNEMTDLSSKEQGNLKTVSQLRKDVEHKFTEFNKLKKEYERYKNRQYDPTISQYKRDSEMNRNMYGMDTSSLALLAVGGLLLALQLMK